MYRQTSDIRRTLLANEIVDHSDVAEASPVGAVTTSSFSTPYLASTDWVKTTARRDGKHISTGIRCDLYYIRSLTVVLANHRAR